MIRMQNATLVKSGITLFKDFNWTINAGEHWVITGDNGAGKTVLLEALAGLIQLKSGTIDYTFIHAKNWEERYAERRRSIHYIPTHAIQHFLGSMSGLYYQQRYYAADTQTETVRSVLGASVNALADLRLPEHLAIDHLLDIELSRLSNGQLRKVLILKSLTQELPKFLLLDYPFEGLDGASRSDLCLLLDFIATQGVQLIVIDHHHTLPLSINKRLVLEGCSIKSIEYVNDSNKSVASNHSVDKKNFNEVDVDKKEVVRMHNVSIQYSEKVIIKDCNWTVRAGERWALIGANGSGKTTLFSLIFADHPLAYSQKVYLFGKRRGTGESIWDIKARINYMGPEVINYLNPSSITLVARDYILSQHRKVEYAVLLELI